MSMSLSLQLASRAGTPCTSTSTLHRLAQHPLSTQVKQTLGIVISGTPNYKQHRQNEQPQIVK